MNPDLPTRVAQASTALFGEVCRAIADERGTHLETAVAAAGYLAGASMLEGTGIDLSSMPAGSPVFVDGIDEIGPAVFETVFGLVERGGVDASTGAVKQVPPEHTPLKSFEQLLPLVRPGFAAINQKYEIPLEMQPFVAARSCAEIILAGKNQVHPAVLKAIAAQSIMKGAKTVPPR